MTCSQAAVAELVRDVPAFCHLPFARISEFISYLRILLAKSLPKELYWNQHNKNCRPDERCLSHRPATVLNY